jgi:hypothetical protein
MGEGDKGESQCSTRLKSLRKRKGHGGAHKERNWD